METIGASGQAKRRYAVEFWSGCTGYVLRRCLMMQTYNG